MVPNRYFLRTFASNECQLIKLTNLFSKMRWIKNLHLNKYFCILYCILYCCEQCWNGDEIKSDADLAQIRNRSASFEIEILNFFGSFLLYGLYLIQQKLTKKDKNLEFKIYQSIKKKMIVHVYSTNDLSDHVKCAKSK